MKFLANLFGKPQPPIDEMSLMEVAAFLKSKKGERKVKELILVSQRLSELAYFEKVTPIEEREAALKIVHALDDDILKGLEENPEGREAYIEAASFHRAQARLYGFGSLQWKMDEEDIEASEVVAFMARSDHAALLPDYLEMLEPEVIEQVRSAVIKEMSSARAKDGEDKVDVLCRLANSDDGAMSMLLNGDQLSAFRNANKDRDIAKAVALDLGIID